MRSQSTHVDTYQAITDRTITALDAGIVPWRRPWNVPERGELVNGVTGHRYAGINVALLSLTAQAEGYTDPRWTTFKQALDAGGSVRKGQHGTPIVFWRFLDRTNAQGEAEHIPMLKHYTVFNVSQCDGLTLPERYAPGETVTTEFEPLAAAETIVTGYAGAPSITHDGAGRAFYRPSTDAIHMPAQESFTSAAGYYATLFHECSHSTGHATRLNRHGLETGIAAFGSETYSREELAAEFGSAFLMSAAGMDSDLTNSAAYVASWLKVLRADKRIAIVAAGQGQKAADHILGRTREAIA